MLSDPHARLAIIGSSPAASPKVGSMAAMAASEKVSVMDAPPEVDPFAGL